jgi:hypothetical protein
MGEALPTPDPASRPHGDAVWREILGSGSPREVLAKLIDGDPLDLVERCQQRLERQALLLELKRLHLRSAAQVARRAAEYTGTPDLDVWLSEHIRRSLKELVAEDEAALASNALTGPTSDERILALAQFLGIEPTLALRGCTTFNKASYETRSAFQAIVMGGTSVADWCRENQVPEVKAKSHVRRALWLLGLRGELDMDEFLKGGDDGD